MAETIMLHGDVWRLADLEKSLSECAGHRWMKMQWKRRPALVDKHGKGVTLYVGQGFDEEKTDLVNDGWTHDHCEVCWWTLSENEDPDKGWGYVAEGMWICLECHDKLIGPRQSPASGR
jgi:hypothetical protein